MDLIDRFNVNSFVFLVFWYFLAHASANPLNSRYNYGNGLWNSDSDNDAKGDNSVGAGNGDINTLADTIVIPILAKPELEATFRKNRFVIFPMAFGAVQETRCPVGQKPHSSGYGCVPDFTSDDY